MKAEEWAQRIKQEEGIDTEIIIGMTKDNNLDLHVSCKIGTMIELVKEMGKIAGGSQESTSIHVQSGALWSN